ncbi:MAG: VOC family protein [Steroidobacteraceae bacterium]
MAEPEVRGRFLWHELMTPDVGKASSFYPKVISWKTQAWPQDKNYTMWMSERGPVGGLMPLPADAAAQGAHPQWLLYIGTPNVDETLDHARRLGAQVKRAAHDVATIGRFAVLEDPQGVTFAIYSPTSPSASLDVATKIGDFSWHELATKDGEAAVEFYRQLFGWELMTRMNMGEMGFYNIFGWKGTQRGGIFSMAKSSPMKPAWLSYAQVASADEATNRAKSAGATVMNGPMEVPGGSRITILMDPQGAAFAVHSLPAPQPKAKAAARPKAPAKPKAKAKTATQARVKAKAKRKAPRKAAASRAPKRKAKRAARRKK